MTPPTPEQLALIRRRKHMALDADIEQLFAAIDERDRNLTLLRAGSEVVIQAKDAEIAQLTGLLDKAKTLIVELQERHDGYAACAEVNIDISSQNAAMGALIDMPEQLEAARGILAALIDIHRVQP